MALDWAAGALGFVGGAADNYTNQKQKQRQWNMEQMSKQADMERKMHFEKLMGDVRTDQAIAQQKALRQDQMSPEAIAYRNQLSGEEVQLAEDKATSAAKAKLIVAGSPEALAIADAEDKRKLSLLEEGEKIKQKFTKKKSGITPEDLINIQEVVIKEYQDVDEQTAEEILVNMGDTSYTPGNAKGRLIDLRVRQLLPVETDSDSGVSKGVLEKPEIKPTVKPAKTFESALQQLKNMSPEEQAVELKGLAQKDPNMYNKVVGELRGRKWGLEGIKKMMTEGRTMDPFGQ